MTAADLAAEPTCNCTGSGGLGGDCGTGGYSIGCIGFTGSVWVMVVVVSYTAGADALLLSGVDIVCGW